MATGVKWLTESPPCFHRTFQLPHSRTQEAPRWGRRRGAVTVRVLGDGGVLGMAPWLSSLLVQRVQRVERIWHGCEVASKSGDAMHARALCVVRLEGREPNR